MQGQLVIYVSPAGTQIKLKLTKIINPPGTWSRNVCGHAWRKCRLQNDCKKVTTALTNRDAEDRTE